MMYCICSVCREKLDAYGEPVSEIYDEICAYYTNYDKPFEICLEKMPFHNTIVRFLELKGYIITTECSNDLLKIIPNIHQHTDKFILYCSEKKKP